ncbi:MAG: hypothetical protein ACM3KR_06140 [Deltaproteobacteria bacterium]
MIKSLKNVLKSKKGQIGEILVVVVLIILAVLGIVKYVMPMFDKNQALAGSAGGQMDRMATDAKNAKWGNVGDEVPAQTVINTWNEIVASRLLSGKNSDIASDATLSYTNTGAGAPYNLASGSSQTFAEHEAGVSKINRAATYYVTTINIDRGTGLLKDITYIQK